MHYLSGKNTTDLTRNALNSSPKRIIQIITGDAVRKSVRKHQPHEQAAALHPQTGDDTGSEQLLISETEATRQSNHESVFVARITDKLRPLASLHFPNNTFLFLLLLKSSSRQRRSRYSKYAEMRNKRNDDEQSRFVQEAAPAGQRARAEKENEKATEWRASATSAAVVVIPPPGESIGTAEIAAAAAAGVVVSAAGDGGLRASGGSGCEELGGQVS